MKIRRQFAIVVFLSFLAIITTGQVLCGVEVVGELTMIVSAIPGGEYEGEIVIKNSLDRPEDVRITQSDYMFNADKGAVFSKPGSESRSNAPWIHVTPDHVTLLPKQETSIAFRIKVPSDNSLKGTYWSLINVDPVPQGDLEPQKLEGKDQVKLTVQTVIGYGVQIVTNLGNASPENLKFSKPDLISKDNDYVFTVNMECTGEVMAIPNSWMDLYDSKGVHVKKVDAGAFFIYPGCSKKFQFQLGKLPEGNYKALLIADCGNNQVFGGQYELEIK